MSENAPGATQKPARGVYRRERMYVLAFGAAVMLATTLPYLLGYSQQGEDFRFTGFVFGVEDGNSYIAKMLSGWAGAWLFRTPYTGYPQTGLLYYLPYLLLGKLASPPALNEQLAALYHFFRIAAGMLSILATYDFLAFFVQEIRFRRLGLALAILGGGLGWILVISGRPEWLGSPPLDFISPETFGFLGIYGIAHLPMARALLLWSLLAYLQLVRPFFEHDGEAATGRCEIWRQTFRLSGLWLASGFFNPLCLLICGIVILVHLSGMFAWRIFERRTIQVIREPKWRLIAGQILLAGLLPGLLLAYNFYAALADPYASQWTAQNRIHSPHFFHYLLAYGVLIPYCWIGGRRLLQENFVTGWFLVGWVLAVPLLVYLPVDLQRRLSEGAWIAICTLGIAALEKPAPSGERRHPERLGWRTAPLLLVFPSTLFLLAGGFLSVREPAAPRFLPAEQALLFETLQQSAHPGAVVLSAYETANPMPAWAPVRVLAGHGPESIRKDELLPRIQRFFLSQTADEERRKLIDEFGIEFVVWGPAERALGDWQPAQASFLKEAATVGDFSLFQVAEPQP